MVDGFRIEYLADYPEHVGACAAWAFGRWWVQREGESLEHALAVFKEGAQKGNVPVTFVVLNEEINLPVAMGSLREHGNGKWEHVKPWIACVYTNYRFRGRGIAAAVMKRLEEEAKILGYGEVFLKSGTAASLYTDNGYETVETIETNETKAGTQTLLRKKL